MKITFLVLTFRTKMENAHTGNQSPVKIDGKQMVAFESKTRQAEIA